VRLEGLGQAEERSNEQPRPGDAGWSSSLEVVGE
jgi:hypothetical protein